MVRKVLVAAFSVWKTNSVGNNNSFVFFVNSSYLIIIYKESTKMSTLLIEELFRIQGFAWFVLNRNSIGRVIITWKPAPGKVQVRRRQLFYYMLRQNFGELH